MSTQFHPYENHDQHGRCAVCGYQALASAHLRYEARPLDHGFPTYLAERARFATAAEARAWASQQPAGRTTSFTGRVVSDITYHVIDLAEECPKTGRSVTACDSPDHRNCPDLHPGQAA